MSWNNINALVLAGGESQRMGMDKGDIIYHQKPQKYHVADMLIRLGIPCYISVQKILKQQILINI